MKPLSRPMREALETLGTRWKMATLTIQANTLLALERRGLVERMRNPDFKCEAIWLMGASSPAFLWRKCGTEI